MPRSASAAITSRRCAAVATVTSFIIALGGCVSYPPGWDFPKSQSEALRLGPDDFLVAPFADALRSHPSESGFRILPVGVDGLLLRLELIERARQSLDLQYYILVFDRSSVYVGSMNFDQRSIWLNTEVGLIIRSPELAEQTARRFAAMTQPQSSYSVTLQQADPPARPRLQWSTVDAGRPVSPWSRLAVPGRDSRCACCRCCRWTASYERAVADRARQRLVRGGHGRMPQQ
jgi:hypothetical protein